MVGSIQDGIGIAIVKSNASDTHPNDQDYDVDYAATNIRAFAVLALQDGMHACECPKMRHLYLDSHLRKESSVVFGIYCWAFFGFYLCSTRHLHCSTRHLYCTRFALAGISFSLASSYATSPTSTPDA